MAENLLKVNSQNFKAEVLNSNIPVLIDFGAQWCMPCRMVDPVIEELAQEYEGKIKFAKVNVDDNTQLATDLQIMSIPHLVLFKEGKAITRIVGANPKSYIKKEIDTALESN